MVISRLNLDKLMALLALIQEGVGDLRALAALPREEFLADRRNPAAAESYLRRSLEAIFDVGRHILAKGYGNKDVEYKAVARLLVDKGVVSETCGAQLVKMAGYRNRMVHLDHQITPDEMYGILQNRLGDLDRFVVEIEGFLERYRQSLGGFTLIELVLLIVLLAILAAVAIPRLGSVTGDQAGAFARKLKAHVAYAQELAMSTGMRHRVEFTASTYRVVNDANGNGTYGEAGEVAADPSGGDLDITAPSGVTLATDLDGGYVEFDTLGVPYDNSGSLPPGGRTVTVSGGGVSRILTIQPETGRLSLG